MAHVSSQPHSRQAGPPVLSAYLFGGVWLFGLLFGWLIWLVVGLKGDVSGLVETMRDRVFPIYTQSTDSHTWDAHIYTNQRTTHTHTYTVRIHITQHPSTHSPVEHADGGEHRHRVEIDGKSGKRPETPIQLGLVPVCVWGGGRERERECVC
jgi:hypothetical protein